MQLKTKKKAAAVKVSAEDSALPTRFVNIDHIVDGDDVGLKYRPLDADHVEELKGSIASHGLDVPIIVWDGGEKDMKVQLEEGGEEYPATFLVAGQHRREAIRELKQEDKAAYKKLFPNGVLCKVISGPVENAIAAQIRENVARKNPDGAELLPMMEQLKKKHKNAEIARLVGKSKAWVTGIFDIAEDDDLKEAVTSKKVGVGKGMRLAKEIKKAKKKGETIDVKGKVAKASAVAKGHKAPKRYGAKALLASYEALPHMSLSKQLEILKGALSYLADPEENALPKQLIPEDKPKAEPKKAAAPAKKAKAKK